jgi:serine/threonine protein kinase
MKSSRRISPGCTGFSDRFQREARTIAALNHPNICTLYDVESDYLVMEYIDGKPPHGPLPVAIVLRYAAQICDALDTAHRRGITHRDLKPANILVTSSGVKLLDFGLAKTQPEPIDGDTETLPEPLTGASMIVGMPHYMAPEQVEGKRVDARTDIFALGCVFYELIAGNKAFRGQRGRLNPQRRSRSTLRG